LLSVASIRLYEQVVDEGLLDMPAVGYGDVEVGDVIDEAAVRLTQPIVDGAVV
jgi:hypothetical protein